MNRRTDHLVSRSLATAVATLTACASLAPIGTASAQILEKEVPIQARGLDVQEHLGTTLPLELTFTNAEGTQVRLADYFTAARNSAESSARSRADGRMPKPAVIMVGYYGCPVVCTAVLDKFVACMDEMDMTAGKDFNFLVFSFDEEENAAVAKGAKERMLQGYKRAGKPEIDAGFAFHAGDVESTRQLSNALGFPYRRLDNGEFSHPVALFVISPEGVITRYIYGFDYPPVQVKLALLDATDGKLAKSLGDYFMNFCYMYDPDAGRYTLQAMRVMQIGGVLVLIALVTLVGGLRLAEIRRRRSTTNAPSTDHPSPIAPASVGTFTGTSA